MGVAGRSGANVLQAAGRLPRDIHRFSSNKMSCAPFHKVHLAERGQVLAALGDGQEVIAGELADLEENATAP